MNARTQPPAGWVTVAEAAAALTKEGDTIDPSNVSRYLARWEDVPSEKRGKFRYVDLAALRRHRRGNVLSIEKREARDDAPAALLFQASALIEDEDGEDAPLGVGPEIQQANLRLKKLLVRQREREDLQAEGELVPLAEVVAITSGALATFVTELERAEQAIAGVHGREIATVFRKARKAAQAKAAAQLVALAREQTHPAVAPVLAEPETEETAVA